jgi:AcrR family transcriptional regulator
VSASVETVRSAETVDPGKRVTKRRGETRQRLLDAALAVFAEQGFGRSTVEMVCTQAGYSRGALYSNYASLEELFLAVWTRHSNEHVARLRAGFESAREADDLTTVRDIAERLLSSVPFDAAWFRMKSEFIAYALRTEEPTRVVLEREEVMAAETTPAVIHLLEKIGRTVPDPTALGKALVALYNGTNLQYLLTPQDPSTSRHIVELFTRVVTAYSIESADGKRSS